MADPVLRELTQRFCEGTAGIVDSMRMKLREGDVGAFTATAHQLAGAGGSYGFHDITREARLLERQAKSGMPAGELKKQLERLDEVCAAARSWAAAQGVGATATANA